MVLVKKAKGRKSTGDIGRKGASAADGDDGGDDNAAEDAGRGAGAGGEEVIFGGGGLDEAAARAKNGLLEAVRRNDTALSSVVGDWVSRGGRERERDKHTQRTHATTEKERRLFIGKLVARSMLVNNTEKEKRGDQKTKRGEGEREGERERGRQAERRLIRPSHRPRRRT